MFRYHTREWVSVVGVFGVLWAASNSQAQDIDVGELVAPPTDGWPTVGGNLFNQRYSPLRQINRSNVGELKAKWRTHLDASGVGPRFSGEAQPVVYDGVVYIVTGADDVFALDVETGRMLWKYESLLDASIDTVCCGWTSRGVGFGGGRVYVGQLDGKLVALDSKTGLPEWSVQAERWQDGFTITSAPLYYDGLVITGFAGAEYTTRGRVKAYDAKDGSLVWTFYTIPGPGEPGHETWPADNDTWRFGGGTVWNTPAADPELGLLYFQTANANPDFNGSIRAGDNLYTSSIVAVEARTGAYRWHFQTVRHDIWDYDATNPVVLFDIEIDGEQRRGLAGAGKTGWVYILDRVTGEPLIGIEDRPVPQEPRQATAATQPYPIGDAFVPQHMDIAPEGSRLVNDGRIFTPFWEEQLPMKPGPLGGANWPPSSYDPQTQTLYVCANDRIGLFLSDEAELEPEPGVRRTGGPFGRASIPTLGIFAAMDMTTNRLRWQQLWGDMCYSGSAVTAGGLVFVGRGDGRFTALDSSDGELLWEFQTDAGVNAPASIFEHNGQQHIVVYSAGNLFAGSVRGDSVWLFSLDGELDPTDPPSSASATSASAEDADATVAGDVDRGRQVYVSACIFCHGDAGQGGHEGAPLNPSIEPGFVSSVVTDGRNLMPAFGSVLTPQQIRDLAAYVTQDLFR